MRPHSTGVVGGSVNDGFVRWASVYAAPSSLCAGAIFAAYFIFLNGMPVVSVGLVT